MVKNSVCMCVCVHIGEINLYLWPIVSTIDQYTEMNIHIQKPICAYIIISYIIYNQY